MYNYIRKTGIDRNRENIRLSCDISELRLGIVRPFRLSLQNIYFQEIGYLIFNYYENGKIFITDFKVKNQGIRHGRLLHDFLLEVLPQIQEIAFSLGIRTVKISVIEGEIYPDGISRSDLVAIYEHFGYSIDGNDIYLEVKN